MYKYLLNKCPATNFPQFSGFTLISDINEIVGHSDSDLILVVSNDIVVPYDEATFDALIAEGSNLLTVYDVLYGFKWLDMCESYTTVGYSSVNENIKYVKSHSPHGDSLFLTTFKNLFKKDLKAVAFSPLIASYNTVECILKNEDINKTSECKSILTYKEQQKNYLTQDMLFFWVFIVFMITVFSIFIYNIVEFDNLSSIIKKIHNNFN